MNYTLADYRRAAGYNTQEELAVALNVERVVVTKWETGDNCPRTMMIPELAKALKKTEGEIIAALSETKEQRG